MSLLNYLKRLKCFIFGPREKWDNFAIMTMLRPEGGSAWYPKAYFHKYRAVEEPSLDDVRKCWGMWAKREGILKNSRVVDWVCREDDYEDRRKGDGIVSFDEAVDSISKHLNVRK